MDWESWLRTAAQPPSNSEETRTSLTEKQIRAALQDYAPLQGRPYVVYAKGSYANNTNVRLNYDVDIAVEYTGYYYYDLCFDLEGSDRSAVGIVKSDDPYTPDQFKKDILGALHKAFGTSAVAEGKIAYRIRENKTTLPADVVPCWEYRRYDGIRNGSPIVHIGSRVFPSTGGHKNNYPKIQQANGVTKNLATSRRYKRSVRALKKLQTRLVDKGILKTELPSYFTESLVYNVTNDAFSHANYLQDMRAVLRQIFNETLPLPQQSKWTHVHQLMYLFYDGFSRSDAHAMADAAWGHIGFE